MFQEVLIQVEESREYVKIENSGDNSGVIANTVHNLTVHQVPRRSTQSLIPVLIEELAKFNDLTEEELEKDYRVNIDDLKEYNIPEKITYNCVIKYKEIIDEYSQYGAICNEALNILDNNKIGTKTRVLKSINLSYQTSKGEYLLRHRDENLEEMDRIRECADNIIDDVKNTLLERVYNDTTRLIDEEDIEIGLIRIICYAFVECKILEKPKEVSI